MIEVPGGGALRVHVQAEVSWPNPWTQLEHGQRVTELMKQKQYSPLSVAEMGVVIYAANEGYLQDIELNKVLDFEASLLSFMNGEYGDLIAEINKTGNYDDDVAAQFKAALDKFKATQSW